MSKSPDVDTESVCSEYYDAGLPCEDELDISLTDLKHVDTEVTICMGTKSSQTDDVQDHSHETEITNKTCTTNCKNEDNDNMLFCNTCAGWVHYDCTNLPLYAMYSLITTKRKYTCQNCVSIPSEFLQNMERR